MESDPESREIVRIIIMLAHNLGLKVVAEGTETEAQITLLKQLNCEMAQGYLFSRPAPNRPCRNFFPPRGFWPRQLEDRQPSPHLPRKRRTLYLTRRLQVANKRPTATLHDCSLLYMCGKYAL